MRRGIETASFDKTRPLLAGSPAPEKAGVRATGACASLDGHATASGLMFGSPM